MNETLLNPNQQRRVGTHLRLLVEDLTTLAELPELRRDGAPYDGVRELIDELCDRAAGLRQAFALPPDHVPDLRRRVAAVAEVWAAHVEDLRSNRLRAYGMVHPELSLQLDPQLDRIVELLFRLTEAAMQLPEQ